MDDKVRRDFGNGIYAWFLKSFYWVNESGKSVYRKDCGDIWEEEQRCGYSVDVRNHVLSYKSIEGAKRAYQILAEPERAIMDIGEGTVFTGERELNSTRIGEESRVFDSSMRRRSYPGLSTIPSTRLRIIARKDRVVVVIRGTEEREFRWGPGPIGASYYAELASRLVERVEQHVNAKR